MDNFQFHYEVKKNVKDEDSRDGTVKLNEEPVNYGPHGYCDNDDKVNEETKEQLIKIESLTKQLQSMQMELKDAQETNSRLCQDSAELERKLQLREAEVTRVKEEAERRIAELTASYKRRTLAYVAMSYALQAALSLLYLLQ